MKALLIGLAILAVALVISACGPAATATPTATPAPTPTLQPLAQIVWDWNEAFNNRDIEAFMALVADDAVLDRGPYGVITGAEKIRATLALEWQDPIRSELSDFKVDGNKVTCHYVVYEGGKRVDSGNSVTIVENGKIKSDLPLK